jgi:glycogen(starch) synthase
MFGWEFPPHISGGLGTACFGLTRGLAAAGVEVLFVVPKAHGDEDQTSVRILGANQVRVRQQRREVDTTTIEHTSTAPGPGGDAARVDAAAHATPALDKPPTAATQHLGDAVSPLLELLAIPSALRAYATEASYAETLAGGGGPGAGPARTELPRAVAELRALLTERLAGEGPGSVVRVLREQIGIERIHETEDFLDFQGTYAGDLIGEVARYALAAAVLAERERGRFDVVHAHDWMTFPAGIVAASVSGKPLVVHVHATEYDRSGEHVDGRVRELEALGMHAAQRVVCVSKFTADKVQRHYGVDPSRIRVVHNAVLPTKRPSGDPTLAKAIPEPIVLFLGRVTMQKGPEYFLEAAAKVAKIEPRTKFVMSGSGDMLPRMVELAAARGIARNVHFTGFLRGKDVERMYAQADVYVMPSVSEPFGITPLEAMALDVPVIVSRQSGVAEVLHNALKCDFWDVDDLANKILALLRRNVLREHLVSEGRSEVGRIRWEEQGRQMARVYEELLR